MQASHYNFFVKRDHGWVVYNAATGHFLHLADDVANSLREGTVPDLAENHLSTLLEAGVIHSGRQREAIVARFDLQKFNAEHVGFTIAPTIECNYACWYCYQNDRRLVGQMSDSVVDATIQFIATIARTVGSFHLNWFGGEPLLAKELIIRTTKTVSTLFEGTNVKQLNSSIITNGLLLNRETAKSLRAVGITSAQVSIDELYHQAPTRRGLLNKDGTPSPILANVLASRDIMHLRVRVNVSRVSDREKIDKILAQFGLSDISYYARVEDNENECSSILSKTQTDMVSRKGFSEYKRESLKQDAQSYITEAQRALKPKTHFCGATDGSLFVIDHKGDVSRCFFSAGVPDERVGSVFDVWGRGSSEPSTNFVGSTPTEEAWRRYDPTSFDDCRNCRVLPLCMGGCSHARVLKGGSQPPCESIKYSITRYVNDIGTRLPIGE